MVDGLRAAWPELPVELVTVVTEGDRRRDVPAAALGGKGIFTAAVQQAVLDGRADLAVHSAKISIALESGELSSGDVLDILKRIEQGVDAFEAISEIRFSKSNCPRFAETTRRRSPP